MAGGSPLTPDVSLLGFFSARLGGPRSPRRVGCVVSARTHRSLRVRPRPPWKGREIKAHGRGPGRSSPGAKEGGGRGCAVRPWRYLVSELERASPPLRVISLI